jgi:alkylhydroperoxidase family enzyme
MAAIAAGDSAALGENEATVLTFVDDVVRNVRASDATLAAVRRHLDDTQVADLILVTGFYMLISRFLETTGVELDDEAIDWDAMMKAD